MLFDETLKNLQQVAVELTTAKYLNQGTFFEEQQCTRAFSQVNLVMQDDEGNTLLHAAVNKNFYWAAHHLLNQGITIDQVNRYGFTALDLAINKNLVRMQLLILSHPVAINKASKVKRLSEILFNAIEQGDQHDLQQVLHCLDLSSALENQQDIKQLVFNHLNASGFTALHVATKEGDLKLIKTLINSGACVNTVSSKGLYPMFMTFYGKNYSPVEEIIELYLAVNPLLVNQEDSTDEARTLLHTFSSRPNWSFMVDSLIKSGADYNAVDSMGYTPLHLACYYGHSDAVNVLLQYRADLTRKNNKKSTPLDLAFIAYKAAKYDSQDAICYERVHGLEWVIKLLLKAGAGLYANCDASIKHFNLRHALIVGLTINGKAVTRTMEGFEEAVTTQEELKQCIATNTPLKVNRDHLLTLFKHCLKQEPCDPDNGRVEVLKLLLGEKLGADCSASFFAQKNVIQPQLHYSFSSDSTEKNYS